MFKLLKLLENLAQDTQFAPHRLPPYLPDELSKGSRCRTDAVVIPSHIMLMALPPALPSLSVDGNIIAFVERCVSRRTSEQLSPLQRERGLAIKAVTETFGEYVLEASSREDVIARVDTILEDPEYYRSMAILAEKVALGPHELSEALKSTVGLDDFHGSAFARVLGPAAVSHLRAVQQHMVEIVSYTEKLHSLLPEGAIEESFKYVCEAPPLQFLTDPTVPVPVARAILGSFRGSVYTYAASAAVFRGYVDGWLGLALAEGWDLESKEYLVFARDFLIPKLQGSNDALPGIKPGYVVLEESARAVSEAYVRFNVSAERSGEPIYPSAT